jgi:hypothetical protein
VALFRAFDVRRGAVRRGVVVGVAVAVVAAGAIGYVVFKPEPFKVADYDRMCESPRSFEEAAAYEGPSPHPVEIVNGGVSLSSDDPEIRAWFPVDPAAVQLVSCVNRVDRGGFVKRCEYTEQYVTNGPIVRTIDLYRGTYTVAVFEARTGKKLGESRVEGVGFVGNTLKEDVDPCQTFLRTTGETKGHSEEEGRPTTSQLREILDPHVHKAG